MGLGDSRRSPSSVWQGQRRLRRSDELAGAVSAGGSTERLPPWRFSPSSLIVEGVPRSADARHRARPDAVASASVALAARQVGAGGADRSTASFSGFGSRPMLDADPVELTEALRAFTRRSAGADDSLVFYAGHGPEMDGIHYLVPVDARLERDVDVRYETVTLDDLLVPTVGAVTVEAVARDVADVEGWRARLSTAARARPSPEAAQSKPELVRPLDEYAARRRMSLLMARVDHDPPLDRAPRGRRGGRRRARQSSDMVVT